MLIKKRRYGYSTALFAGVMLLVMVLLSLSSLSVFRNIIERLTSGESFTTGRTEIWRQYIGFLLRNPVRLLFGCGIGANFINEVAAHNTYIDFLYYYGIVGTFLMLLGFRSAIGKHKVQQSIFNISPLICFLLLISSLSLLYMYDFAYLLILVFGCWRENWDNIHQE